MDFLPANCVVRARPDRRPARPWCRATTSRFAAARPTPRSGEKMVYAERLAHELRMPLVRLVDGTGGGGSVKSLETMGHTYVPFIPGWELAVEQPLDGAGGGRGARTGRGARRRARGGLALLGDGARHRAAVRRGPAGGGRGDGGDAGQGGARRRARADARAARWTTRRPTRTTRSRRSGASCPTCRSSVWEAAAARGRERPARPARGGAARRSCRASGASPTRCAASSRLVFDRGSLFEMGARYGRSLITALARLDGRPVGVLCSTRTTTPAASTADASEKLTRFVDLCDQFRLPVVNFVDKPGFVIGTEAERRGTIRRGTRALTAVYQASVPWASILVRKVFGVAGAAHGARGAAEPALRLAVGRLGLAADRGRHRGRLPARARGRRRPGRAARRDRGAPERGALAASEPRSASWSRRSSTRATRGRCLCEWAARAHELVAQAVGG